MCGLAEASIASTVIGGLLQFQGMRAQGEAAEAEAEYRAAVGRNNAMRAEFLAEDAIERGKEDESEERLRGRILVGALRAQLASSGQVIDEGSAGDLVVDQAEVNELNARTIRNNAAREAQEFRIRASQFENEASLTQIAGSNARRESETRSFGTLLGTGGKVASKWYDFRREGAFAVG